MLSRRRAARSCSRAARLRSPCWRSRWPSIPLVTTLGYTSAIAVGFAILAALTLLPALFGWSDRTSRRSGFPSARPDQQAQSPFWTRMATGIANHRWPVMIAVLVALLAMSIPTLSMHLGQEDVGAEPTDTTARQAYDLITKGFGAGTNGPFLISAQLASPRSRTRRTSTRSTRTSSSCRRSSSRSSSRRSSRARPSSRHSRRRSSKRRSSQTSSPTRRSKPSSRQPTRGFRPCERTSRRPRASSRSRSRSSTRRGRPPSTS